MNEARNTRNQTPFYSDEDLMLIRSGLDKDLFPNVNWMDQLLVVVLPHVTLYLPATSTKAVCTK